MDKIKLSPEGILLIFEIINELIFLRALQNVDVIRDEILLGGHQHILLLWIQFRLNLSSEH